MIYRFKAIYESGEEYSFDVTLKQESQTIRDAWLIACRLATEEKKGNMITLLIDAVII
jgi:hypothetical protein